MMHSRGLWSKGVRKEGGGGVRMEGLQSSGNDVYTHEWLEVTFVI